MKKINNSGFVLVETLIVSVVVMVVFSILYTNFYPMMGEYELRENYDDVDSKYAAFWIKRILQTNAVSAQTIYDRLGQDDNVSGVVDYVQFTYDMVNDADKKALYQNLVTAFNINVIGSNPAVYITKYRLGDDAGTNGFKGAVRDKDNGFSRGMQAYVNNLPMYSFASINRAEFRIIIEFHRTKDDNDFYTYSTIEVIK